MNFLLVALAVLAVCSAQSDADWERFSSQYGKQYRSADEISSRRAIWDNNWRKIKQHNEEFAKGVHTYTLGENQFADMTFEEFSQERLGLSEKVKNQKFEMYHESELKATSLYVDLRNKGWVSSVKDQGRCGGCWSFATVAAVEALYSKVQGVSDPDLSEQQIIDCSKGLLLGIIRRNNGCNGGQLEASESSFILYCKSINV
jgi:C1A family cysteine protease